MLQPPEQCQSGAGAPCKPLKRRFLSLLGADELKRCLRLVMDTNGDDLLPTVYLITNRLAPAHEAAEIASARASSQGTPEP